MEHIHLFSVPLNEVFGYFVIYSFLGWCTEVAYAYFRQRKFVNRGFLAGPYCPIYGFGILFIILLLTPFRDNFLVLFLGTVMITSFLELVTGYLLEVIFHAKWWDYSQRRFNLKGYICLGFSMLWGGAGALMIMWVHPFIKVLLQGLPSELVYAMSYCIFAAMVLDAIHTGANIFKLNQLLKELTERLERFNAMEIKDRLVHEGLEAIANMEEALNDTREDLEDRLESTKERMMRFKEKNEQLVRKAVREHSRIIRAFPHVQADKFKQMLIELKKEINK